VKRKLNANSNRLDMGIFTINTPMKNYLFATVHKSLDPLCVPIFYHTFKVLETPFKTTKMGKFQPPSRSHHIPTIAIGVVTQIRIPMVEIYVPLNQWHLQQTTNTTIVTCCDVAYINGFACCSIFIKRRGPIVAPCLFGQL
jgi:hypothetical protein